MANESEGDLAAARADRVALQIALAEVIEGLPAVERAVFVLRYVQRLSVEQTAERLRIPVTEVRERGVRALAACRVRMGPALDGASLSAPGSPT